MALTLSEKIDVVVNLGHSGGAVIEGNINYNSIINDRLTEINQEIEDKVREYLTKINASLTRLENLSSKGQVKRIGDIELEVQSATSLEYKEYYRLLRYLSNLLDVPIGPGIKQGAPGSSGGRVFGVCI